MSFLLLFFAAFSLTCLLEFPFYYFLLRGDLKKKIFVLLGINLFTLPVLWLALPFYYSNFAVALLAGEALILIAEFLLLWKLLEKDWKKALIVAAGANIFSFAVGILLV